MIAMVILVILLSAALGSLSGLLGPKPVLELIVPLIAVVALLIYTNTRDNRKARYLREIQNQKLGVQSAAAENARTT